MNARLTTVAAIKTARLINSHTASANYVLACPLPTSLFPIRHNRRRSAGHRLQRARVDRSPPIKKLPRQSHTPHTVCSTVCIGCCRFTVQRCCVYLWFRYGAAVPAGMCCMSSRNEMCSHYSSATRHSQNKIRFAQYNRVQSRNTSDRKYLSVYRR